MDGRVYDVIDEIHILIIHDFLSVVAGSLSGLIFITELSDGRGVSMTVIMDLPSLMVVR